MNAPTIPTVQPDVDALLVEQAHLLDDDTAFARLACEHPEACHTARDYPNWQPGGAA